MTEKIKILDYKQLNQKVNRLSWQIYENNINELNIVIVGISDRGSILAIELMKVIEKISNINVTIGRIDLKKKIHMIKLQILIFQKVIIKIKSLFYVMMFLILEKH